MEKVIKFVVILIVLIIVVIAIMYNLIDKNKKNQTDENMKEKIKEEDILTEEEVMDNEEISINVIVNNKTYTATLYNNETVKELITHFPMTLDMNELNSNEKYHYLNFKLTTNPYTPSQINAGDIKLYGNDCLVVFYQSFSNSYSYTDLGTIDDVESFTQELENGSVTLKFEMR